MDEKLNAEILRCLETYKNTTPPNLVSDFAAMSKKDLFLCHFGLGQYIRNHYLRNKNELYDLFIANGISHPDDMSSIMIEIWHEAL